MESCIEGEGSNLMKGWKIGWKGRDIMEGKKINKMAIQEYAGREEIK